jgi:hypothetical protein
MAAAIDGEAVQRNPGRRPELENRLRLEPYCGPISRVDSTQTRVDTRLAAQPTPTMLRCKKN